jgi:hypothetical protein
MLLSFIFKPIVKSWKANAYKILVMCSIIFLVVLSIYSYKTGQDGTWDDNAMYDPSMRSVRYHLNQFTNQNTVGQNQVTAQREPRGDSKGEIECRRVLEEHFGKPFPKQRPTFMTNSVTTRNLEIDCFNHDLRLGVEYNGIQHYQFVPHFHKNKETFMLQRYRDDMKKRLCQDNNITLISIPYTVPIEQIRNVILNSLPRSYLSYK